MAIVLINENSETGKKLMKTIRSYKDADDNAVQICIDPELEDLLSNRNIVQEPAVEYKTIQEEDDDDLSDLENIPFERIPGLPYTHEERMAALRKAEEQRKLGLSITTEEFEKEMEKW